MEEIVLVSPVRTAVGAFGGSLRDVEPQELCITVIKEILRRSNLEPGQVDEIILGHVLVNGETHNIARQAAILADFPLETPAYTLDRQCSSGLQAMINGALQVMTGNSEIVLAGGVESMSQMEYYTTTSRWGARLGNCQFYDRWTRSMEKVSTYKFGVVQGMLHTAENVAQKCGITRAQQDEFSVRSHRLACAAIEEGRFKEEIVPVSVPQRKGPPVVFERDEHPRADASVESLAKLKPVFGETITAGNSSGMNDAAGGCLIMAEKTAEKLGLQPMGYLRAWAVTGVHPAYMGLGPVGAIRKLLQKTGLDWGDIDLIELNEAFAAQALGCLKELGITDLSNVNVNGSGISLGHPVGATGARIMATLLNEMKRRKARYGLESMCMAGGLGLAALIERK